jgi:predicted phage tail protein
VANKTSFNSGRTLDAATENIEILTGARGNKLDKAITLRELGELGLANLVKVGSSYKASSSAYSSESNSASNVERPSPPENVSASGAFNVILVQWDLPRYKGHQYAEIWRADEDNLSKAVWIGATAAVIYPDPIGGDAKAYYWVRFVNSNGDKGAFNSQSGTYAETSVDIAQILDALTNQISADQLTADLLTPIQVAATQAAQWSVKATVGELTGGVGFINDGTTTRFTVAAQQFAIVDSTLGENKFVPFVVSGGKVVMANAFIDTAYIQSLAAAQVTAEKVNSLNLTSVNITGGTLTLGSGNNIMMANGGALGIGKGGPYSGWGDGWNTIIYQDGSLYTNRLYADSGKFTGEVNATSGTFTGEVNAKSGSFDNVTINSSCVIKGTLDVSQVVGDMCAIKQYDLSASLQSANINAMTNRNIGSATVKTYAKARTVVFSPIIVNGLGGTLEVLFNNNVIATKVFTNTASNVDYSVSIPPGTIPAGNPQAALVIRIRNQASSTYYCGLSAQSIFCIVSTASTSTFV